MLRRLASVAGALLSACAVIGACGDDGDAPPAAADASVRDVVFPSDVEPREAAVFDAGTDATRSCRGMRDEKDLRCDDFDQGALDLGARGWSVASADDAGPSQIAPRVVSAADAATPPRLLEAVAEPTDAGLPRSVVTDVVEVTKPISTLEADVLVAEWDKGPYRVLRFDFGPTPQELTGITLDVLPDGKWRCVGYGTQALGNAVLELGVWHHVKLVMAAEGTNLRGTCQVDDVVTAAIPGQLTASKSRRLEIGVTTYSSSTPRTRVLYDNVDFHAD